MKFMTFNSSCSYAGIANMLERYGIETGDREIALAMKLPYLFSFEDGAFVSGPMLQSAQWFDLYLNPIGFRLLEKVISCEEIGSYLQEQKTAMLGIKIANGGKHAVIYTGMESGLFVFLNNKWETEDSPCQIRLTGEELKACLEQEVIVATLREIQPEEVDLAQRLEESIAVLRNNLAQIIALCNEEAMIGTLRSKLNTLFRPLFLDGITMLDLVGEAKLSDSFADLQHELLCVLRQEPEKSVFLKDYISMEKLKTSVDKYIDLIVRELNHQREK